MTRRAWLLSLRHGHVWRPAGSARCSMRGQATLEFALVLPVLLLIAVLAVDVGRVTFDYIGLRNAAMEGAKYGSYHPDETSVTEQRVRSHFGRGPVPSGLAVTVNADENCSEPASIDPGEVRVAVTRTFTPISLALLQFLAPDTGWILTVRTTATARCMT
jgi:Flp pilus assembly protein TadG